MNETYLYPYSVQEAIRNNELPLWRESHRANIACKQAIESAIRTGFDGMNLNPDCLKPVLEEYGYILLRNGTVERYIAFALTSCT